MLHAHFPSLPEIEQRSPSGRFRSFARNVSLALGGIRNAGTWGGGHPFDFQIRRLPPGAAVCPFHAHLAQWELLLIRRGTGIVRAGGESHPVGPGDVFVHPPGEPHQLTNTGADDLEVFIFADNPPLDACVYPDSNKWGLRPPGTYFRVTETDYFDGEEPPVPGAPAYQPSGSPPAPALTPFATRRLHLDAIPWEPWSSPKGKFRATSKELSIALGAKRHTPSGLGGHPFDLEYGKVPPGHAANPFHRHAAQWELFIFLEGTVTVRASKDPWSIRGGATSPSPDAPPRAPSGDEDVAAPSGRRELGGRGPEADESRVFRGGDVVLHPPGVAHQFTNTGDTDLLYLLVADNPPVDYWFYPDSNKWGFPAPRKFFRPAEVDYYDGEE